MPPPELMDELVEEILLRFPPQEPARLARAALVCKRWRRLVSEPGFGRRFREFHHRALPMLGFLCNHHDEREIEVAHFVPTTSFVPKANISSCSCTPRASGCYRWRVDDARHGRVLLSHATRDHVVFMVWDPITDQRQELPALPKPLYNRKAAIACAGAAAGTCDHLDCCSRGPFLVVCMSAFRNNMFTCIYSSDASAWSKDVSMYLPHWVPYKIFVQSVLVGKSLYFMFRKYDEVLEYDLEFCKVVSVIQLPGGYPSCQRILLITTEDGELGYATMIEYKLYLWSRNKAADSKGDAGWVQIMVIDLGILRVNDPRVKVSPGVVGFADGVGVVFVMMNGVFFTVDLKTYETKAVYNDRGIYGNIVPYMSFCTPAHKVSMPELLSAKGKLGSCNYW